MPLTIAARLKVSLALRAIILASALTVTSLSAQSRPAGLNGSVVDSLGHPIAGASVRLVHQSPSGVADTVPIARTTSDTLGLFRLEGISPGPVVLTVEHPRYRRIAAEAALAEGVVVTVRITLFNLEVPIAATPVVAGLRGVVTDTTGAPVADAEVTALEPDVTVRTDTLGRFNLPMRADQSAILRVRRLGYRATSLQPLPMRDKELQILLHPLGQQLARVVVRSTWGNAQLEELLRRQKRWGGTHILRDEIERRNPSRVSDLLQGRAGMRVRRDAYGNGVVLGRLDCQMAILVNGVPVRGLSIDDVISANDVAAIEAYNGASTPTELLALAGKGCGALAVWTR